MTAARSHLQRPPGYAPKGTSFGLLGSINLSLTPFLTVVTLIPVVSDGVGLFLNTLLPSFAGCVPLVIVLALGLHKRRLWFVRFLFAWGAIGLACYFVGVLTWVVVLLEIVPELHPDLRSVLIVSGIGWLYFTLCAFWVTRMLRLRYWQPWTRPEQWEPGDETPPRWAPPRPGTS